MPNTLILATQRTGSTLLCSELADIGGLGAPGEHLLDWLRNRGGQETLTPDRLDALLAPGRDGDGNVGLKLMADYLPALAELALGERAPQDPVAAGAAFIDSLAERYGPFAVFRIDREDRFDQALSRYLAVYTGVYFRTADGEITQQFAGQCSAEAALECFDVWALDRLMTEICAELRYLDQLGTRLRQPVHPVPYEALCERREETLALACAHAGIAPPATWPRRWMRKVVDPELGERFRREAARQRAAVGYVRRFSA